MMRRTIVCVAAVLLLASCGRKDEQFCKCLTASEALNDFSSEVLQRGAKLEDESTLKTLRDEKEKECVNYKTMSAEETLAKRKQCD